MSNRTRDILHINPFSKSKSNSHKGGSKSKERENHCPAGVGPARKGISPHVLSKKESPFKPVLMSDRAEPSVTGDRTNSVEMKNGHTGSFEHNPFLETTNLSMGMMTNSVLFNKDRNRQYVRINFISPSPKGHDTITSTHIREFKPSPKRSVHYMKPPNTTYTTDSIVKQDNDLELKVKVLEGRILQLHKDKQNSLNALNEEKQKVILQNQRLSSEHHKMTTEHEKIVFDSQKIGVENKSLMIENRNLKNTIADLQQLMESKIKMADQDFMNNVSETDYTKMLRVDSNAHLFEDEALRLKQENHELQNHLEGEITKNLNLIQELGELKLVVAGKDECILKKNEQITALELKLGSLAGQFAALSEERAREEENKSQIDHDFSTIQRVIQETQDNHKEILRTYQRKLTEAAQHATLLQQVNAKLKEENNNLRVQKLIYQQAIENVDSKSEVVDEEEGNQRKDSEQSVILEKVERHCSLEKDVQKVCNAFEANFFSAITAKDQEIAKLKSQIKVLREQTEKTQQEILKFQSKVEQLREEQERWEFSMRQQAEIISQREIECEQLTQKCIDLQRKQDQSESKEQLGSVELSRRDCRTCEGLLKTVSRLNAHLSPQQ